MSATSITRTSRRRVLLPILISALAAAAALPAVAVSGATAVSGADSTTGRADMAPARPLPRNTPANTATTDWALAASGGTSSCSNVDNGCSVAVDQQGNIYLAAGFDGTETIPSALTVDGTRVSPAAITTPATAGAFVAKWSSAGALQWVAPMTLNAVSIVGLAIDATGSVVVAGGFVDSATFSSAVLPGGASVDANASVAATSLGFSDIFVAKWSTTGVLEWVAHSGGPNGDGGADVAVDATGSVVVTGNYVGVAGTAFYSATTSAGVAVDNAATVPATAGDGQLFVARWANDGTLAWMAPAKANNGQQGAAVAVDATGSVLATGYISGIGGFDSATTSAGAAAAPSVRLTFNTGPALDLFVAKWNSNGSLTWIVQAGSAGASGDVGYGIAVDDTGSAYVTGYFDNTAVFPSATNAAGNAVDAGATVTARIVDPDGRDAFIAKWNNDGRLTWMAQVGGNGIAVVDSVAIDDDGAAVVSGTVRATTSATFFSATTSAGAAVSAGTTVRTSTGNESDAFIAKWSPDGRVRWAGQVGGTGGDYGGGIAIDRSGTASDGAIYATGGFISPATVRSATPAGLTTAPPQSVPLVANNADNHVFLARWNERLFTPTSPGGAPPSIPTITPPSVPSIGDPGFDAVTPQRLLDTRGSGPVAPGSITRINLDEVLAANASRQARSGTRPGIGVVVQVTAVGATQAGYLTVFACDTARPDVSNLNYQRGGAIANTAISAISTAGDLCVFSSASTNLLIDITGWFGNGFTHLAPTRLLDTRRSSPVAADSITRVRVPTAPGTTRGAAMNLTAVDPQRPGYVTVYDCSQPGSTSTLNVAPGSTIANLAISGIAPSGEICIYSSTPTQLLVDLFGWFDQVFTPITTRVLDTRTTSPLAAGTVRQIPITGRPGLPAGIGALALTLTVVNPDGAGFATIAPCTAPPTSAVPTTSTVNYSAGQTIASTTVTGLTATGSLCLYTSSTAHYLVDISGWYTR